MKNAVITGSLSGLAQAVIKQLLNKGISPELIEKYSEGTDLYLLKENL